MQVTPSLVQPTSEFTKSHTVSPTEAYNAGSAVAINNVTHHNQFVALRGQSFYLSPSLSQGSSVTYTINETLPAGLSLDSKTGIISGTPTLAAINKTYIVSAKNLLGESNFRFDLEVKDFFGVEETSPASSFILHKVGDTQNNRSCRISGEDIKNARGNLDIRCYLDGQEEDFQFESLKLSGLVGPGICEYIKYTPYSFWQYPPKKAPNGASYNYVTGDYTNAACSALLPGAYVTIEPDIADQNYCPGNWDSDSDGSGPNCDEGSFTVINYDYSYDSATSTCKRTLTSSKVKCGGNAAKCLAGPVKDILNVEQLSKGMRGLIYSATSGASILWTHKSPSDFADFTNLRVVNGSVNNLCTSTKADVDTFISTSYAKDAIISPFGRSTTSLAGAATPYYKVECLDAAYDAKASITIIARDWDRAFHVTSNIDELVPGSGLMNSPAYNNYADWDNDYTTGLNEVQNQGAANYTGGSCGATGGGTEYAFPAQEI